MSDIVDELRSLPEPQCKPCNEAADAIEWLRAEIARLRLTDAEREAVDRARRAFRDMDHNDMTMQQIEDYEALCDMLERLGGCTPQSDCGADRKSVASQRCRDTGGQPFDSAPITLTNAEREAVEQAALRFDALCQMHAKDRAATLRGLLERME